MTTPRAPRPFAVFDIDGTVIRWQLYHAIVSELASAGCIPAEAGERIRVARMAWKTRGNPESFSEYELVLVHAYHDALTSMKVSDYVQVVDRVFETHKDQVYTYTRDLIRQLKADGYCLLAISGSQQEIIEKFAAHYGFDYAVGAEYKHTEGMFTGERSTTIHGKDEVLKRLVQQHTLDYAGSIAVGDSQGDISMLQLVEQPIAFNPTRQLFQEASRCGWKVVVERKNMVYELLPTHGNKQRKPDGTYLLAQTNAG